MKTKRNLSASIPNETRKAVYARDGYRCALCDDTHGLQIHHIVHRSCGGNDTPCNLITLCWRCHAEAHGTWVAERHAVRPPPPLRRWRRELGAKACAPAAGFRCAPLCPCCAVSRGSGGGRPLRQAPAIPFFWSGGGWLLRGHSAAVAPFAGLAAGSQGRGACSSGLWPPRRCGGAPLRSGPAPRFWPRGGAILFSLRRVWGLRRLRAALKVYRTAHAAQSGAVYMASP